MRFAILILAIISTSSVLSSDLSSPGYRSVVAGVSGEIRISGSPEDRVLIEALQARFRQHHPEVVFSNRLYGPESTLAGVYTGVADVAFMARELREPMERMAFQWVKLTLPFVVDIANAGFRPDRPSAQLGVFVHDENPVEELSLASLDAIFGAEHKRGTQNARHWGDVAAHSEWASRPIDVLGPNLDSIAALYFRRTVMLDSRKWNPGYRETGDFAAALRELAEDPAAISFAPAALDLPGTKAIAISEAAKQKAYLPGREDIITRRYPLTRVVSVALYRADGEPIEPRVNEFLRFVLSPDGQEIVDNVSDYLPLDSTNARAQLERLD